MTWESIFLCRGDVPLAIQLISDAARREPRDETLQFMRGWLFASDLQYDSARIAIGKAYAIDPRISVYPLTLGIVSEMQGQYDTAIQYYAKAILLDPDLYLSAFFRELKIRHPEFESLLKFELIEHRSLSEQRRRHVHDGHKFLRGEQGAVQKRQVQA